jgi:hypothetical protein
VIIDRLPVRSVLDDAINTPKTCVRVQPPAELGNFSTLVASL